MELGAAGCSTPFVRNAFEDFASRSVMAVHPDDALANARKRLDLIASPRPYRIVAVRSGRVVVDWNHGIDRLARLRTASVAKSLYVSMLGIALAERKFGSVDDLVASYYPVMADITEGCGPKPGRYTTEDDASITLRQLAGQVSGYLKPDEKPGEHFHYQTFGMNVLAHAIATAYGHYLPGVAAEQQTSGIGALIETRIRDPIGARWSWSYHNFSDLESSQASLGIYGNSVHVHATALDLARLGWLWRCDGEWFGDTILPSGWIADCIRPLLRSWGNSGDESSVYGLGFWLNRSGSLWPDLPENSFSAWGKGGHNIWISMEHDLVISTSPLPLSDPDSESASTLNSGVIPDIVGALI